MPAECSFLTFVVAFRLVGEWWCVRWWNERDSMEFEAGFWVVSCGDCDPVLLCNVFALLSHDCGGEWLTGWFCKPAKDRTWSNNPLFNSLAWCSCALARKHAIELFL